MSVTSSVPRVLIAGTNSGCGKTTVTSGIMAALKARGLVVQPFKAGPDFIDPSHHSAVCGRYSRNLDPFMMGDEGVRRCFAEASKGADICVIEGVMGLFDGVDGTDISSTAHIARILDAPVILVTDISGMSRSINALIKGYTEFDTRLRFAGVIMTKGGSERHREMTTAGLAVPLLGWIPRSESLKVESRHLGLFMAEEDAKMKSAGEFFAEHCDVDAILAAAEAASAVSADEVAGNPQGRVKIAVAFDAAFCFYYRENFRALERAGAEILFYSPLADALPDADGYYFGGGYPELYAEALAGSACIPVLRKKADEGHIIYGECGGLMWLGRGIETADGKRYRMANLLDCEAVMQKRFAALDYCIGTVTDGVFFERGMSFRGHEFHYSKTVPDADARFAFTLARGKGIADGKDGIFAGSVLSGYTHMYFTDAAAGAFVRCVGEGK